MAAAVFYYDFNSPYAYLAAMRVGALIPDAEWRPIAFPMILHKLGRLEEALARDPSLAVTEVSRRADERGLPAFNPPGDWPFQSWSLAPLRAALFAGEQGRMADFSIAAFRKLFVEARSLAEHDNLVAATRESGLDQDEVEAAIQNPRIKQRLADQTDEALAAGVTGIPTVLIGQQRFWGDDRLEEAAVAAGGQAARCG